MAITPKTITHVSHCFGYGGIDLSLEGIFGESLVTIAACEIEAYAVANGLQKVEKGRFGGEFPFASDVKRFPFGDFRDLVDVYSAGFPCQPFSLAGKQLGTEDPRHLFPFIIAGIDAMRPACVFLENVDGIVSAKCRNQPGAEDGEPVLLYVLRELERRGYCPTWGIFSAEEVGASHRRNRVFILAYRKDSFRWRELAEGLARGGRGGLAGIGATMANYGGVTRRCGGALAHGPNQRRGEGRPEPERDQRVKAVDADGGELASDEKSGVGVDQVDSNYEGLQGRILRGRERGDKRAARAAECSLADHFADLQRRGLPAYPPGPEDLVTWARVLQLDPSLAPAISESAIRRMADGNPAGLDLRGIDNRDRIDRLRLAGGGVVPATAAIAFLNLAYELLTRD